jgi:hypothetical protein
MYLDNRITTKWWDSNKLPQQEHISILTDVAYKVPSKQSVCEWRLVILGPSPEATLIKRNLYENHTWCDSKGVLGGSAPGLRIYNGQYLAPYLFTWVTRWKEIDLTKETIETRREDYWTRLRLVTLEIGISSGAVLTAAENMGLSTGFGGCHDQRLLADMIGYPGESAWLALGIGYGEDHSEVRPVRKIVKNSSGRVVGYDRINHPIDRSGSHPFRLKKPSKNTLVKII